MKETFSANITDNHKDASVKTFVQFSETSFKNPLKIAREPVAQLITYVMTLQLFFVNSLYARFTHCTCKPSHFYRRQNRRT